MGHYLGDRLLSAVLVQTHIESTETVDIQLFSTWDYLHFLLSQCKETIS